MLAEDIKVALEGEANAYSVLVAKNLLQDTVKLTVVGQCNQVYQISVCLVTQLQKCGTHGVELCHLWAPFTVHAYIWFTNQLPQQDNVLIFSNKPHLDLLWQVQQVFSKGAWCKLILGHHILLWVINNLVDFLAQFKRS
jgi:hypothetical protein